MSSNILLVDIKTGKQSPHKNFIPAAFLKLSTFYRNKGDFVEFLESPNLPKNQPDVICFSPVFQFKIRDEISVILAYKKKYPNAQIRIGGISVSLKPDIFKKYLPDAEITTGICGEIEELPHDYETITTPFSYGFTSRGCINKCPWCVVPKIEGDLRILPYWKNALGKHTHMNFMDNNILACGENHFEEVLREIKTRGMTCEFNQGMDCVVFAKNENYAKIMHKYKVVGPLRFSWDSKRQDNYILKTIELVNKYDIKFIDRNIWYVLYGFNESAEVIYKRIKLLKENNQAVKLMLYKDIKSGCSYKNDDNKDYQYLIGHHYITGIITPQGNFDNWIFKGEYSEFKTKMKAFRYLVDKKKLDLIKVSHIPILDKLAHDLTK